MGDFKGSPGGQVMFTTGEKWTSTDGVRVGTMVEQTVYNGLLARLFCDSAGVPMSGFMGDDCLVSINAGLVLDVAKGFGMFYDSTATGEFAPWWLPMVLDSVGSVTLGAHHATLPRIDVVCLAPATEDDNSETVYVKSGGVVSSTSENKRRKWAGTLSVVAGTPNASPAVPATPAGKVALAEVSVPATAGAVTVRDVRPILPLGYDLRPAGIVGYCANHIPSEASGALLVATSSGMIVSVAAGVAYILGRPYYYKRQFVTIPTNGSDQVYYIVADQDGTIQTLTAPTTPSVSQVLLCTVSVPGGATSVISGYLSDGRVRQAVGTTQLQASAVTEAKKPAAQRNVFVTASVGAESANHIDITIQAADLDGTTIASAVPLEVEMNTSALQRAGANYQLTVTTGTANTSTGSDKLWVTTDATGAAVVRCTDASGVAVATVYALIRPVNGYVGSTKRATLNFT